MFEAVAGTRQVDPGSGGGRARPDGARERHVVALLVVLCAVPMVALAVLRYRAHLPMGDEPHYLIISQALAEHGSLDVQRIYDERSYWSFYPMWIEPHVSPGPDGAPLPLHSIGGPVLWLVPYLLWGRAGAVAFMVAVSLLVVVTVFRLVREFDIGTRTAFGVALAFGVGTPVLTYSSMSFVEPIGALVCVVALRVLHRGDLRRHDLLLASAGLGLLPWVHSRFLLFPPLFLALLLLRVLREAGPDRGARLLCTLAPAAALLLGLEVYALLVWDTLNPAPNQVNLGAVPFQADPLPALLGTALDQEAGVLPNFPVLLFVLPGVLLSLSRRYRRLTVHVLAAVVPYTLMVCSFPAWDGAWSPPARFLAVVLPMLAVHVAVAVDRARGPLVGVLVAVTALYGGVLTWLAVLTPDGGFSAQRGSSAALASLGALVEVDLTRFAPSSALEGQAPVFLAWTVGALVLAVVVRLLARPQPPDTQPPDTQPPDTRPPDTRPGDARPDEALVQPVERG